MPRFFDDYSNTYLTHDSSAGRKQQRRGWKFRENFRLHYEQHVPDWRKGPMGLASAQQAFLQARGADDPMVPPLPEGWKEETDEWVETCHEVVGLWLELFHGSTPDARALDAPNEAPRNP